MSFSHPKPGDPLSAIPDRPDRLRGRPLWGQPAKRRDDQGLNARSAMSDG